jgi:hypothetical protein
VSPTRHQPWADSPPGFSIGLKPIEPGAWLEGGETAAEIRARKTPLLVSASQRVWAETPGSRTAQAEAAGLVSSALGVTLADVEPPLLAAALQVSDDLCLMERRDGVWRLTALALFAGTFFSADQVVGRSLRELHGPVPGFTERLLPRVERIFDHLGPETILQRCNWTVLNSTEPHLPDSGPVRAALPAISLAEAGDVLFLRVERQTLRRLPASGALLFTIRIWTERLGALAEDEERLAAFARAWPSAPADFRSYKRLDLYDPLVERFLRERGVLPQGERPHPGFT